MFWKLAEEIFGIQIEAIEQVKKALAERGFGEAVSLSDIVECLDFELIYDYIPDKAGAFLRMNEKILFVNNRHNIHRQKLSIAHEIGHIMFDKYLEHKMPDTNNEMLEFYSDSFAALLISSLDLYDYPYSENYDELAQNNPEIIASLYMPTGMLAIVGTVELSVKAFKWMKSKLKNE